MSSAQSDKKELKVGSRKSQLALVQTHSIVDKMKELYPDVNISVVTMSTTGDNILDKALSKIGEKSLFTRELEDSLSSGEIDLAVHSLKDMPTTLPPNMVIAAVCRREDCRDAVVMRADYKDKTLATLPEGSVIGTSSLRRVAQLTRKYSHLKFADVRGNLNTRFRKLDEDGTYAALILAAAGIIRLGMDSRITEYLEADTCMYAVGQGALAVECASTNTDVIKMLSQLNHKDTLLSCLAERSLMRTLEGGCSIPMAVNSKLQDGQLTLTGGVFSLDGKTSVCSTLSKKLSDEPDHTASKVPRLAVSEPHTGIVADCVPRLWLEEAEAVGNCLAQTLLELGAGDVLKQIRVTQTADKLVQSQVSTDAITASLPRKDVEQKGNNDASSRDTTQQTGDVNTVSSTPLDVKNGETNRSKRNSGTVSNKNGAQR